MPENCAIELKDAVTTVNDCPADSEVMFFITPSGYVGRLWSKLITCITAAVLAAISVSDDIEITVDSVWNGRNYYDMPSLSGKRFRLFRNGILLNKTQYKSLTTGGWELLLSGDILEEGQIFTVIIY